MTANRVLSVAIPAAAVLAILGTLGFMGWATSRPTCDASGGRRVETAYGSGRCVGADDRVERCEARGGEWVRPVGEQWQCFGGTP